MTDAIAVDVVVVGGGLAGLCAALRVAESGRAPLVLEQGSENAYLCNSRYTGGLFHIAMDDMLGESERVMANVDHATGGDSDDRLTHLLVEQARPTIEWLKRQGVRSISAGPMGLMRNAVAPPAVPRVGVLNWQGRAGDVLLRTLGERLSARGGRILRGTRARSLLMKNGNCVGLVADQGGTTITLHARAVVIADGGFQANLDLLRRYVSPAPEKLVQRNARTGKGDGLMMAESAGAKLIKADRFYGHLLYRAAIDDDRFWPYPMLDTIAASSIVVGGDGKRFCDEGLGGVYITNELAKQADPLSAWVIFDHAIWNGPGREFIMAPNPHLIDAGGTLASGNSIEALASQIGLDAGSLRKTVEMHNEFVAAGRSPEGPARTSKAGKVWPIHQPPYHALPLSAGITYTMGGIAIDDHMRVLDLSDTAIPNLFAAGASTGGLEGGRFAAYTGGLSKAAVFGLRAGESIAAALTNQ
jgi:fumarate reductase flavoprotein subunit